MGVHIIEKGDIFRCNVQTLVNTVNCVGVMGKGIAYRFKKEYPDMFEKYEDICQKGLLNVGKLWLYKTNSKWILNFPTKTDWRFSSRKEYLEIGLQKFISTYKEKNIQSIAFPLLGANNGNLSPSDSLEIMLRYLNHCEIPVYVYLNYCTESDEMFQNFMPVAI